MTKFQQAVVKVVNLIPEGKVMSYGQVALYVGLPRAARAVGWILKSLDESTPLPWWRVINNQGRISIKGNKNFDANFQKKLLEKDGVIVSENFEIHIKKYRHCLEQKRLKKLQLDEDYVNLKKFRGKLI